MNILGLSCFYHDSAACLLRDGVLIGAAQEERFTRIKHDPRFPGRAIDYCLSEGGIGVDDLDYIVFYDKPFLTFDRLLMTYLAVAPRGIRSWLQSMPAWLGQKLHVPKVIRKQLGYKGEVLFTEHHEAHAASAFYPSPFAEAAILTIDGVGEWATASYGIGTGKEIRLLKEMHFPDSLGLLYSAFTYFIGFKVNSGEYKLMGLAPYGKPVYRDLILDRLIDLKPDGSLRMNLSYFDFISGLRMTNKRFAALFDGPARQPETPITQREMDIAASIQAVTEEAVMRMAHHVHRETGMKNLCLAGGVALNCVANGLILKEGPFENIWIQPAAGDAGGALGAAYSVWHRFLDKERPRSAGTDLLRGSYLGPMFSQAQVTGFLDVGGYPYDVLTGHERAQTIARSIADGKIVGHFSGRMEFGPRALGARSILGDPRDGRTQKVMNLKIKFRESFRPFAPAVMIERIQDYFELDRPSPYMLLVAPVAAQRRIAQNNGDPHDMMTRLNFKRSDIPAVTHLDYSARLQSVDPHTHPEFYQIIAGFAQLTGCAVIVNTSFNVRGEPIVCTPEDAYRCFMRTEMDILVLEDCILYKNKQPPWTEGERWRDELVLD
jgi:carbamoyltransferase